MRKLPVILAVAGLMLGVAGSGSAVASIASISGDITPTSWQGSYSWATADFGIIADTAHIVDAQSQPVAVSGTIGTLPANSNYWVEIGLVPKSVYDNPEFGFLPYIFNKGVTLYTKYDAANFEVGLLHKKQDPLAICVNPVTNDGSISYSFTLTPSGAAGGSGTMIVDGTAATYGASTTLAYTQDLSQSYLVGMVWVDSGNLDSVTISAVAVPEPASIIVWSLLGVAWAGLCVWRRRRRGGVEFTDAASGPAGRAPWPEENRIAVRQIIERGLAKR